MDSLDAKYTVNIDTGCWEWQREKNNKGYGRLRINGKKVSSHRHYYELHAGPIPDGLELDHKCRNRGCCNPEHLEIVTHKENVRRGLSAKMTWEKVIRLREHRQDEELSYTILGKTFGISKNQAWLIGTYRNWVK